MNGFKTKAPRRKWLHLALGCLLTAAGLMMLKHAQVFTGGTAGMALSLAHMLHLKFYILFFLLNFPFLLFSFMTMGRSFTLNTIFSIMLLSALTSVDRFLPPPSISPTVGAIAGGILIGVGVCALFRNGASLGGSNIVALYLNRKFRINPGKTNFVFDSTVLLISLFAYPVANLLLSALSIAVTSSIMALYKRRNKPRTHKSLLPHKPSFKNRH
ncbi:YitT family protein [Paenibacillus sp. NEAU-GSW1]|uniref:YitT family protein n=1 Tax=Paenibacillus sp. NEAU-GSW1 TaxID=2682486 RepID=UPI001C12C6A4|nr:YitT family protein [Paenibacillus sp. NEAU-GSW1]